MTTGPGAANADIAVTRQRSAGGECDGTGRRQRAQRQCQGHVQGQAANEPHGRFHFETGRHLAQRLGYPAVELDHLPPEAIESFARVGYHLGLAAITPGERVVDLGSGSGMDLFRADHRDIGQAVPAQPEGDRQI